MSAITPGVSHHESLGPLDWRFVDVHDLPWQDTAFAGVCTAGNFVRRPAGNLARAAG